MMHTWTVPRIKQLTKEATTLADWLVVRHFANQVYGEGKAVKVEIETDGKYNDEGGTDYRVEFVTAYGKDGHVIPFDLTLPFWTQPHFKESLAGVHPDGIQDVARLTLKDWYPWRDGEKALIAQHGWLQWGELPVDVHNGGDETYDLTTPPSIPLSLEVIPSLAQFLTTLSEQQGEP
jgi:hypothetical protein